MTQALFGRKTGVGEIEEPTPLRLNLEGKKVEEITNYGFWKKISKKFNFE